MEKKLKHEMQAGLTQGFVGAAASHCVFSARIQVSKQ